MTQRDTLTTIHEPFGDAFYYGPERMSSRFENDELTRVQSGFGDSTYATIFNRIEDDEADVNAHMPSPEVIDAPVCTFIGKFILFSKFAPHASKIHTIFHYPRDPCR